MNRTACTCGARYEAFRAVDDEGHALTFASVQAMLRVGSDDPELWRAKGRAAVLRLWGQLKRAQWDVTHGYCAGFEIEHAEPAIDLDDTRADLGDVSFDVDTFNNAEVAPDVGCACDHCTAARLTGAPLPVHRFTYSNRKDPRPMKSTINLRRTLAAYTAREGGGRKRPGPVPCAVKGCPIEGKAHTCPADGERHSHGRIHYTYCHSTLPFREGTWQLLCDVHAKVCADELREFSMRGCVAWVACPCPYCVKRREREHVELCAGLQNAMGACTLDHCQRGVACTCCQLTFNRAKHPPAAACPRCGGWTAYGGMSQHAGATEPVHGRIGCTCNRATEIPDHA